MKEEKKKDLAKLGLIYYIVFSILGLSALAVWGMYNEYGKLGGLAMIGMLAFFIFGWAFGFLTGKLGYYGKPYEVPEKKKK